MTTLLYDVDDLRTWARLAPIESTKQAGVDRIRHVLLLLIEYAAGDGIAYPSSQTLADQIANLNRRDVRNALDALAEQGFIERVPGPARRSVSWRVLPDLAGMPAKRDVAGDLAGDLAGMPATNRSEGEGKTTTGPTQAPAERVAPHPSRLSTVAALLADADRDDLDAGTVWQALTCEGVKHPDAYLAALADRAELVGFLDAHGHLWDGGSP